MGATIEEALRDATHLLRQAGVDGPRQDARLLLATLFDGNREIIIREPEMPLDDDQLNRYREMVDRRVRREPVSHILGVREFWSRDFVVNPHVLDPRPDSETLIEAVLDQTKNNAGFKRMLDLGTGSGCLLLTLLAELPGATGVGVDQSEDALAVAKENAQRLSLEPRAEFVKSDWFSAVQGQYDLILSNPPYIETEEVRVLQPEVTQYEPLAALDGGPDGLACYRHIISKLSLYLRVGGYTIFEVGQGQADTVASYLEDMNFIQVEIHEDLASIGRCVSGRLKK